MSSALVVSLYYGLVPITVIAVAAVLIRRGYGTRRTSDR